MLASPYDIYFNKHTDEDYNYFVQLIKNENVDTLVVGLPYNMMGEEQEIAHKAREFGNKLAELSGCKLVFVDERMTSVVAEDILRQKYRDWRDRKKNLDKYSAMVILQDYLDTL
jgi:putative Holliday junction resolvase